MNRFLILGAFGLVAAAGFLFLAPGASASENSGSGSASDGGDGEPEASGVHPEFDSMIADAASAEGIEPALLKAIVAKESGFNPNAINPEKNYTLMGAGYAQYDAAGQRALVAWIKAGNDPATISLNPSVGLAQVRVSEAHNLGFGIPAQSLFDPQTCLKVSAALLAQLFAAGITLDTIDAYNVGQSLHVRNFPYRDAVNAYYLEFVGDFS